MNQQAPATHGGLPHRGPSQRRCLRALRLLGMGGAALVLMLLLLSGDAISSEVNVETDGAPVEQDVQEAEATDAAAPAAQAPSIRSTRIPYDYMWSFRSYLPTRMTSLRTTHQKKKSSKARITTMLLISSILAVYGASRWLHAGEIAVEAQTAAAARREELQESLAAYEEKVKTSAELAKQLAEKKGQAAQMQAELQAAAREAEKAERELVEELSKQTSGGVDFSAILNTLQSEAVAAENEAEALRQRLEAMTTAETVRPSDEDGGDSLIQQAFEEQRQLAVKKRDLIEKLAHRAALEAKWGEAIKAEGGDILEAIEQTTKEIEQLKQKKLQLKRETIEQAKQNILLEEKKDAKEQLEVDLHVLKTQVDAKIAANEADEEALRQEQERQNENLMELEELKAKIKEAREERALLAANFEEKRQELLKALTLLDEKVDAKEKDPRCASGICKETANKLMQKRDRMKCEHLLCEAVKEHEKLEELEKTLAATHAKTRCAKTLEDIASLESQLTDETLSETERTLIEQRIASLKEQVDRAAETILMEADRAEKDLFLFLEFRHQSQFRISLEVANTFDDMLDEQPGNEEIEAKFLTAQMEFEQNRLEMLKILDVAAGIARERSFSHEINRLFKEHKEPESALEMEMESVKQQIEETKRRLAIAEKRHLRARKVLISRRKGEEITTTTAPVTRTVIWKRRLMDEGTAITYYKTKIARLEKVLHLLPVTYMDKLERAKKIWEAALEDYSNEAARFYAVGVSKSALKGPGITEEIGETAENFVEEREFETDEDAMVAALEDDESFSDADLVDPPPIQPRSFAELIADEIAATEAEALAQAAGAETFDEEATDV